MAPLYEIRIGTILFPLRTTLINLDLCELSSVSCAKPDTRLIWIYKHVSPPFR